MYRIALRLTISHNYYEDSKCPDFSVSVDSESRQLLHRYRMLFKPMGPNQWALIVPDDICDYPGIDESITFLLRPLNREFMHYTICDQDEKEWLIGKPLHIVMDEDFFRKVRAGETMEKEVAFTSGEMYWKYVFISKSQDADRELKLEDLSAQLTFSGKKEKAPNGSEAQTFLSAGPIKLQNRYSYKLRLWEVIKGRDKLLYNELPPPMPGEYDLENTKGEYKILVKYIYY